MLQNMPIFDNYLTKKEALTFDQMSKIHEEIIDNADKENEDFQEIWKDIIKSSFQYTSIHAE